MLGDVAREDERLVGEVFDFIQALQVLGVGALGDFLRVGVVDSAHSQQVVDKEHRHLGRVLSHVGHPDQMVVFAIPCCIDVADRQLAHDLRFEVILGTGDHMLSGGVTAAHFLMKLLVVFR